MSRHAASTDEIDVTVHGRVRLVTLDRPDVLNAVNESLHTGLVALWPALAADEDAAVVVLTGAGRAFSAGGDIDYISRFPDDAELRHRTIEEAQAILWSMIRFPLPIIAAVNGPAVGLGMSLALASDIVVASDRASFADPHVAVGLVCGDGGAALLPLVAPLLRAKELLFTGDRVSAELAVQLGIANRIVPHDVLLDDALALAQRIADQPTFALRETKRVVQLGIERSIAAVVEAAADAERESMATTEHRERISAMDRARERRGRGDSKPT
jgi:enoyl-CoA hydratase/carnithine racemase